MGRQFGTEAMLPTRSCATQMSVGHSKHPPNVVVSVTQAKGSISMPDVVLVNPTVRVLEPVRGLALVLGEVDAAPTSPFGESFRGFVKIGCWRIERTW